MHGESRFKYFDPNEDSLTFAPYGTQSASSSWLLDRPTTTYASGTSPEDQLRADASYYTQDQYRRSYNKLRNQSYDGQGNPTENPFVTYDDWGNSLTGGKPTGTQYDELMSRIPVSTAVDKLGFRDKDFTNATIGPNKDQSFFNYNDFVKDWSDSNPNVKYTFNDNDKNAWYQGQLEKQFASFFPSADAYTAYSSGDVNSINSNWNAGVNNSPITQQPSIESPFGRQLKQPETTEGETGLPAPTQIPITQTPGYVPSVMPQQNGNEKAPTPIEQPSGLTRTLLPPTPSNPPTTAPTVAPAVTSPLPSSPTTTGIGGLPAPDLTQPSTGQTTTQPANTVPGMNFNPATDSYNPIPSTVPATNLGALASVAGVAAAVTKGNPMANLLQGSALPNITTTQTASTTAPDWYNQFLSGLSTAGQAAVNTGGVAGASPLQTAAYNAAPTAINAGLLTLNQATDVATGAAGALDINQYMNPYTSGVVDEIGRLGQKNFTDILAPNAVAGAAGSGQFGSRRGMQIYGDVARDSARATTGQQATALQSGYQNAVQAALQKQQNETQAGNLLGTLSSQGYTQGVGGLDVLSRLGAQQQATSQAALNYPMSAQQNFANLLRGFTVPTTQNQTFTGPIPGAYSNSPLSQIAGLGLSTAGIFANKVNAKGEEIKNSSVISQIKRMLGLGDDKKPGDTTTPYPEVDDDENEKVYFPAEPYPEVDEDENKLVYDNTE